MPTRGSEATRAENRNQRLFWILFALRPALMYRDVWVCDDVNLIYAEFGKRSTHKYLVLHVLRTRVFGEETQFE